MSSIGLETRRSTFDYLRTPFPLAISSMWFERITGFPEINRAKVRENLSVDGTTLKSRVNGKTYACGILETPSLAELRQSVVRDERIIGSMSVSEIVADVQQLHLDEANAGALFQVASQFNLLEMASPDVTPEHGITGYEFDRTQGPACAVAAGAGTIYRNYFANVKGDIGQTSDNQIDCLADIGAALNNEGNRLWEMRNGYALASRDGLIEIDHKLESATETEVDALRQRLRVGIQWNTAVTLDDARHTVSQAYCSALPVGYSNQSPALWRNFAKLILEAPYEATICAGLLNTLSNGNNKVFLTLVGGGVFGNEKAWITDAIERSLALYQNVDLDIAIVSYGRSKPHVQRLVREFSGI